MIFLAWAIAVLVMFAIVGAWTMFSYLISGRIESAAQFRRYYIRTIVVLSAVLFLIWSAQTLYEHYHAK